jgi:hypothetical protein
MAKRFEGRVYKDFKDWLIFVAKASGCAGIKVYENAIQKDHEEYFLAIYDTEEEMHEMERGR